MRSELSSALVVGFAVTGQAAARALCAKGASVVAVDDGELTLGMTKAAAELGIEIASRPSRGRLSELATRSDLVVLSPGVPPSHPIFDVSPAGKIVAEVELAFQLCEVPVVAVTGTNGKTTVTSLVTSILHEEGLSAEAVGNIGRPFIEAVGAAEAGIFVVEVSSFQLAWTKTFRPRVGCWLNFAEDHLDWHAGLDAYAAAKARIWANQRRDDVAVANADDPVVMGWAAAVASRLVTFGQKAGDVSESDGAITSNGTTVCAVEELPRQLPHDVSNACAATAVALSAGAGIEACRAGLLRGVPMPHRIELVAELDGARWYDDSKATTPSAVLAALVGFEDVVLIAGGRNKGLDFKAITSGLEKEESAGGLGRRRLRGVVAIGESAAEVLGAFSEVRGVAVARAASMGEAVERAGELSVAGGTVLLSPGAASFDWYRNYGERGDDFARAVTKRAGRLGSLSKEDR